MKLRKHLGLSSTTTPLGLRHPCPPELITPPPSPSRTQKQWPLFDEVGESSSMGASRGNSSTNSSAGSCDATSGAGRSSRFLEDLQGARRDTVHAAVEAGPWGAKETLTAQRWNSDGTKMSPPWGLRRRETTPVFGTVRWSPEEGSLARDATNEEVPGRKIKGDSADKDAKFEEGSPGKKTKEVLASVVGFARKLGGREKKDKGKAIAIWTTEGGDDDSQEEGSDSENTLLSPGHHVWWRS